MKTSSCFWAVRVLYIANILDLQLEETIKCNLQFFSVALVFVIFQKSIVLRRKYDVWRF